MRTARQFAGAIGRVAGRLDETDPDRVTLEELRELLASTTLTTGDATDLFGVSSKNTVKRLLESGAVEGAVKTPGGHWRIPPDAIVAYRQRQVHLRASGSLKPTSARRQKSSLAGSTA